MIPIPARKPLRLGFVDTFGAVENYFTDILSQIYDITRDDINPNYLIFGDRNFGDQNKMFNNRANCIKIFYTGENERPSAYDCHYSISFDHNEGTNFRLPLYALYDYDNHFRNTPNTSTVNRTEADLDFLFSKNAEFCSFIVKNGACDYRNYWFHRLSQYKRVQSGGPLFNNIGYILPRGEDSVAAKMKFLDYHKFNLCFENSSYPGYVTEKLYDALCAKTIPIYWGSPTVPLDFNPKAFLTRHDYDNDDLFFEAIKLIDQNDDLYREMYLQPMFIGKNKFLDSNRFLHWFSTYVY